MRVTHSDETTKNFGKEIGPGTASAFVYSRINPNPSKPVIHFPDSYPLILSPNLRGALFMAISMAGFTINDTFVKLASAELNAGQIMFVRGLMASVMMFLLCWKTGALRPPRLLLQSRQCLGRSVGEMLATVTFLTGLAHMPIGNASAILQALPLAVTMAAALFLGEPVGWRRWAAIIAGFIGVMIIVRPGAEGFNGWSLMILACVFFAAARDMFTKSAPAEIPSTFMSLRPQRSITLTGLLLIVPFRRLDADEPENVLLAGSSRLSSSCLAICMSSSPCAPAKSASLRRSATPAFCGHWPRISGIRRHSGHLDDHRRNDRCGQRRLYVPSRAHPCQNCCYTGDHDHEDNMRESSWQAENQAAWAKTRLKRALGGKTLLDMVDGRLDATSCGTWRSTPTRRTHCRPAHQSLRIRLADMPGLWPAFWQGWNGPQASIPSRTMSHSSRSMRRSFPAIWSQSCRRRRWQQAIVVARADGNAHPVFSLWPVNETGLLRLNLLSGGPRKVIAYIETQPHVFVDFDSDEPFFNINTPDDLAAAKHDWFMPDTPHRILGITGWKNSGKTTLTEKLVQSWLPTAIALPPSSMPIMPLTSTMKAAIPFATARPALRKSPLFRPSAGR